MKKQNFSNVFHVSYQNGFRFHRNSLFGRVLIWLKSPVFSDKGVHIGLYHIILYVLFQHSPKQKKKKKRIFVIAHSLLFLTVKRKLHVS